MSQLIPKPTPEFEMLLGSWKVEEGRQSMDQLVDSDEEIQEMKNDLETVDNYT